MTAPPSSIPTEIIRTIVAIAETGSLTRAAKKLGISQPAATSQVKRIQEIIGGSIFIKTSNGSVPTELGRLFLEQGRRVLAANDQMLRLGGLSHATQPVRLGISAIFAEDFINNQNARPMANMTARIDSCVEIAKSLVDSHVDVACILDNVNLPQEARGLVIDECNERIVWVRSPTFTLTPGRAIPILAWPGDSFIVNELERHGIAYNVVLHSREYHAKLKAAVAGFGMTAMPKRLVPSELMIANDDFLPPLPSIKALLCARANASDDARGLASRISAAYFHLNEKVSVAPKVVAVSDKRR